MAKGSDLLKNATKITGIAEVLTEVAKVPKAQFSSYNRSREVPYIQISALRFNF
jgi:hypothetical protein